MAEEPKVGGRREKPGHAVRVEVDLSRIAEGDFDPSRPLRIATLRNDEIIAERVVTPAEQKNPRRFEVELDLGPGEDGVAGATVVVAPADDRRNLHSQFTARKFVYGTEARINAGTLVVNPAIYAWWRFCWFPRKYRISGRVVRQVGDCTNPVAASIVQIFDVDYCWWWYNEDLIITTTTDAAGFFEVEFTWCVPLWCIFRIFEPPRFVDVYLRDRLWELLRRRIPWPIPPIPLPDPPPDDPWEFEALLEKLNVRLPVPNRQHAALPEIGLQEMRFEPLTRMMPAQPTAGAALSPFDTVKLAQPIAHEALLARPIGATLIDWREIFGDLILWPMCEHPCDWRPDIRIRVIQNQPGTGTVEIYRDTFSEIRWNLSGDLTNLTLEANAQALYHDVCQPDPPLGNCMLFERVGNYNVSTLFQPDLPGGGASYGTTPALVDLLGRTVNYDRPFCLTPGIHGDFGLASQVDYYQVQSARWTAADFTAWMSDPAHTPAPAAFSPVSVDYLPAFGRMFAELDPTPFPHHEWRSVIVAPQTVAGIPGLFKSRRRFEQEYVAAHGGAVPAPDFVSGWYWDTTAMTRLFNLRSAGDPDTPGVPLPALVDGVYTFRLVGYTQTGVDGSGQPVLAPVNMGLPDGVIRMCTGSGGPTFPAYLTMRLINNPIKPVCEIISFKKNGVTEIGECDILILDTADSVEVEFKASDVKGNLDQYDLTIQRGSGSPSSVFSFVPVSSMVGPVVRGPNYALALGQGATRPAWNGGTWKVTIPASAFITLGGSCAYDMELHVYNRHTDGWNTTWSPTYCKDDRAFTVILAADKDEFCKQLGC